MEFEHRIRNHASIMRVIKDCIVKDAIERENIEQLRQKIKEDQEKLSKLIHEKELREKSAKRTLERIRKQHILKLN